MINHINSTSRYLRVSSNNDSYPYITNTHINDGQVRFSSHLSGPGFDVCVDGKWTRWNGNGASVELTQEAEAILMWAGSKMMEEHRIKQLAQTNPSVADAAEALKKAEEQLRIVMAMTT